ncbi:MAG: sugar phosphate isomerase/epimerase family protein [Thermoproteota archaeon]
MNIRFKPSFITDEVSQDLNEVREFASSFNIDAIEIRTILDKGLPEILSEKDVLKRFLKDNGLKVCAIASPTFKCDIDSAEEYEKHLETFRSALELAGHVDTKLVRAFTFWKKGRYEDYKKRIVEKFGSIVEMAEGHGVTIVVENEPSTFVGNGRTLADFINSLGARSVKALWDPGNELMDEEGEEPYPTGFNYVKKFIRHVHVKDGVREGSEVRFLKIGEGQAKIEENLKAFKEMGYEGYVSLETHWRIMRGLREPLLRTPGGKEFSSGAYAASYVTMQGLLEIMSKIG